MDFFVVSVIKLVLFENISYCNDPFAVQEMETVRVTELVSAPRTLWWCPIAEAYPMFPDFQLDLLETVHAEELLSA